MRPVNPGNVEYGGAPWELVLQGGEHEGSPGVGGDVCSGARSQVYLLRRADAVVSRKRRLPPGSERADEAKRRPAQCPREATCESYDARTCEFICQRADELT
jgi:hypothetical protein